MMIIPRPTKPGHYWFRTAEDQPWLVCVFAPDGGVMAGAAVVKNPHRDTDLCWLTTREMEQGQWSPLATPEELADMNQRLIDRTEGFMKRLGELSLENDTLRAQLRQADHILQMSTP